FDCCHDSGPPTCALTAISIEHYRHHDYRASDDALGRLGCTDLCETCRQHGNDQDTKKGTDDRTAPAHEAGAADHYSRDHLQLQPGTGIRVRRLQTGDLKQCRHTGQQPHQTEYQNLVRLWIDTRQTHRFFVGTNADQVTTEHR